MKPLEEEELDNALQRAKEVLGQSRQNPVMETICKVCPGSINPGDPLLLSFGRYLEEKYDIECDAGGGSGSAESE